MNILYGNNWCLKQFVFYYTRNKNHKVILNAVFDARSLNTGESFQTSAAFWASNSPDQQGATNQLSSYTVQMVVALEKMRCF